MMYCVGFKTLQKKEICAQLFVLAKVLVYVDIDQGIHKVKLKVAQNEKRKKNYMGFLFP